MLWVAMLAYRDASVQFSALDGLEQRRKRLFANFVDAMFKRRSVQARYTPKQTVSWLCWLASGLRRNGQTVFYREYLDENWLSAPLQQWLWKAATVVGNGLIFGLAFGLVWGLLVWIGVLRGKLAVGVSQIVEAGLGTGLMGLVVGLVVGLIDLYANIQTFIVRANIIRLLFRRRRVARVVLFGCHLIIFGLIFPLVAVAIYGFVSPHSIGAHKDIRYFFMPVRAYLLVIGSIVGLILAPLAAFLGGEYFSLRHLLLRLMLWGNRSVPLIIFAFSTIQSNAFSCAILVAVISLSTACLWTTSPTW